MQIGIIKFIFKLILNQFNKKMPIINENYITLV